MISNEKEPDYVEMTAQRQRTSLENETTVRSRALSPPSKQRAQQQYRVIIIIVCNCRVDATLTGVVVVVVILD